MQITGDVDLTCCVLVYRSSIASATIWRWSSSSPLKPGEEELKGKRGPSILSLSVYLTLGCCLVPPPPVFSSFCIFTSEI